MSAIDRPLNDDERSLLNALAIRVVADQTNSDPETAAAVLDKLAGEGEVELRGDAEDVNLVVSGKSIVHAKRDWLAFHASFPGYDPMRDGQIDRRGDSGATED